MDTPILSALILCSDLRAFRSLVGPLQERKVSKHVATNPAVALENLAVRKFDLLIVDLDGIEKDWPADFYKVNGCCYDITVIAIAQDAKALRSLDWKRVQFTLQKPLVAEITGRTIEAACNAILVERQPAFRCTTNLSVLAVLMDKGKERTLPNAILRNISYTGASLESNFALPIGETVSLSFYFPESGAPFQAAGKVIWSDSQGRCGIQFQHVSAHDFSTLRGWLTNKAAETGPLATKLPAVPVSSSYSRFGF